VTQIVKDGGFLVTTLVIIIFYRFKYINGFGDISEN